MTEHNLDLAFNSLDAQREACDYVKSQPHEGWRLIREKFEKVKDVVGLYMDPPAQRSSSPSTKKAKFRRSTALSQACL